jgi:hypothetical protein
MPESGYFSSAPVRANWQCPNSLGRSLPFMQPRFLEKLQAQNQATRLMDAGGLVSPWD